MLGTEVWVNISYYDFENCPIQFCICGKIKDSAVWLYITHCLKKINTQTLSHWFMVLEFVFYY